jgi:hypothetical protein
MNYDPQALYNFADRDESRQEKQYKTAETGSK